MHLRKQILHRRVSKGSSFVGNFVCNLNPNFKLEKYQIVYLNLQNLGKYTL